MPRASIHRTFSTTIAPRQAAAAAPAGAAPTGDATKSEQPAAPSLSSCPEGTVLNGLNYFKGKTDPVALKDEEYPEWLWSCLNVMVKADAEGDADAGDEFCMSY